MVGFQNYIDTFTNPDFWHSVGVTIRYAFIATAVEMVLGMCIALLLNHESAFSRFLRLVLIFPLMIAPVIGALIWLLITNPTVGILRIPAWMDRSGRLSMERGSELGVVLANRHRCVDLHSLCRDPGSCRPALAAKVSLRIRAHRWRLRVVCLLEPDSSHAGACASDRAGLSHDDLSAGVRALSLRPPRADLETAP